MDILGIIKLFKNKNVDALDFLYRSYYKKIFNISYCISRDNDLAFEATQEAFIKAQKYINQLKDTEKFEAWLIKIGINITYDLIREKKKFIAIDPEVLERNIPDKTFDFQNRSDQKIIVNEGTMLKPKLYVGNTWDFDQNICRY